MVEALESCQQGLIEQIQRTVFEIRPDAFVLCTNFFPPMENPLLQLDTAETETKSQMYFF